MRISTSSFFNANVAQLDTLTSNLSQTQQQISTGLRIVTPADDPAGAALALQVSQTNATNTQYLSNIGAAQNATNVAVGALQSVTTLIQSMQTAAVQAGSSALTNADRATLASTLQGQLGQLIGLANSTDATGNYLFAGFKGATQPFVQTTAGVKYNGDDGQQLVQVSTNQQLATSDSGANIFMRIKNGNGTFTAGTATTGTSVITNPAAAITAYNFSIPANNATISVDGTAVTVNTAVTVGGVGTGPGTLAAAIQAGLTAAGLTSYSVSAAAGGGLQITNANSTSSPVIAVTTDPSGLIAPGPTTPANSGTGIISQGSLANPPPTAAQQGNSYQITFNVAGGVTTYSISGSDLNGVALPAGSLPAPSTGLPYTSGQNITFNGIQFSISGAPANGDTFTTKPSTNESVFTTIQNLINTLNTGVNPSNPASATAIDAGVNTAINNLSNALNSVLTAEASQGTRLNQMSGLTTTGNNLSVQYKSTLSTIQDLDYNKALSDYSQQQTILKAAQQSFVQVEGLSMFNYMR